MNAASAVKLTGTPAARSRCAEGDHERGPVHGPQQDVPTVRGGRRRQP